MPTDHSSTEFATEQCKQANSHPLLSFPQEVLSHIFLHVVYDPPRVQMQMENHVKLTYSRLHVMLAVCTVWRDAGRACGALWSIVPVIDSIGSQTRSRPLSTQLSLDRAGASNGLYLAMLLAKDTSLDRLDSLEPHFPQFSAINIHECVESSVPLTSALRMLLKDGVPPLLSKLSLRYSGRNQSQQIGKPTGPLDQQFAELEPQLIQTMKSLAALRLDCVAVNWQSVVFSSHLVTLRITGISLGTQSGINSFISALESATELSDLRLISVKAILNKSEGEPTGAVNLPKLQALHLENLTFTVLGLFANITSLKPYRLYLNLCAGAGSTFRLGNNGAIEPFWATNDDIYSQLKTMKIDTLVLNLDEGSAWDTPKDLQKLLESVPSITKLQLNYFDLDADLLKALAHTLNPLPTGPKTPFPVLGAIEIHCFQLMCPLVELGPFFEEALNAHRVSHLVLGKFMDDPKVATMTDLNQPHHDKYFLDWLRQGVPQFRWMPRQTTPIRILNTWQLWDV